MSPPSHYLGYVVVLAALASAAIHLLLAPRVMAFDRTTGVLFYLNGLGWIGGVLVCLSRYWRRELYPVAAGYAIVTILAFFDMGEQVNPLSIASKVAEAVVALVTLYLYTSD
uniref:DUF7475 family protein n=1 Tax=Halorarum halophilum TaxID=2743090 RepID=UPI001C4FB9CE|nr:hypothetical protein [Halobaculum halophilum]